MFFLCRVSFRGSFPDLSLPFRENMNSLLALPNHLTLLPRNRFTHVSINFMYLYVYNISLLIDAVSYSFAKKSHSLSRSFCEAFANLKHFNDHPFTKSILNPLQWAFDRSSNDHFKRTRVASSNLKKNPNEPYESISVLIPQI